MKIYPVTNNCIAPKNKFQKNNVQSLSFEKNMSELYYPFAWDFVKYAVSNPNLSINDLGGIIHKYSPKTQVDDMINYQIQDIRNPAAVAKFQLQSEFDEDGEVIVNTNPKTVYLDFSKTNEDEICGFLAETLHEMTHIFQQEADDRLSIEELCEMYYNNVDNKEAIANTTKIMDGVFIELENSLTNAYLYCAKNGSRRKKDREDEFLQHFNLSIKDFIETTIAQALSKCKGEINYNLLLDYCILKAKYEEEAYLNMLNFRPKLIEKAGSIGLRIEMYDKMISSIKEIAKSFNPSGNTQG